MTELEASGTGGDALVGGNGECVNGGADTPNSSPSKKKSRYSVSEEELCTRTLPDYLAHDLDMIFVGINPGYVAAETGRYYAGSGNHFWKCMYMSGVISEELGSNDDYRMPGEFGVGFTNIVERTTRSSSDLNSQEIKAGSTVLTQKILTYRPKIVVFNGKEIYRIFSGKKEFSFGKQPERLAGTDAFVFVMPSSSARCSQLPRAADKVPYYAALRKLRDFVRGRLPAVDESELVFSADLRSPAKTPSRENSSDAPLRSAADARRLLDESPPVAAAAADQPLDLMVGNSQCSAVQDFERVFAQVQSRRDAEAVAQQLGLKQELPCADGAADGCLSSVGEVAVAAVAPVVDSIPLQPKQEEPMAESIGAEQLVPSACSFIESYSTQSPAALDSFFKRAQLASAAAASQQMQAAAAMEPASVDPELIGVHIAESVAAVVQRCKDGTQEFPEHYIRPSTPPGSRAAPPLPSPSQPAIAHPSSASHLLAAGGLSAQQAAMYQAAAMGRGGGGGGGGGAPTANPLDYLPAYFQQQQQAAAYGSQIQRAIQAAYHNPNGGGGGGGGGDQWASNLYGAYLQQQQQQHEQAQGAFRDQQQQQQQQQQAAAAANAQTRANEFYAAGGGGGGGGYFPAFQSPQNAPERDDF